MKKVLCVLAVFLCILTTAAAEVDLSGMSYDELVALKDQINKAIWESQEWQEVTVPQGVWQVGKDIPAGKWVIKCADVDRSNVFMSNCQIEWGNKLADNGKAISWSSDRWQAMILIYNPNSEEYDEGLATEYEWDAKDGDYIVINHMYAPAVFTPYSGKPSLGFK